MGSETFDDILDQCLAMADAGASIDECVALHPQYADELRSHLELIGMIREAGQDVPASMPGEATGRARLLAAVDEKANAGASSPALGILVPMQWAFAYAGRLAPARALPAALIILLLTGSTLGALAATDTGGIRSVVTDVVRLNNSNDDDDIGDDGGGPVPGGDGGGGDGPGDLPLPIVPIDIDLPGAPDAPPQPTGPSINQTATPDVPVQTPAMPSQTPANPTHTPAAPTLTPAAPTQTPANPTITPAAPTLTPAAPTLTPANPTQTPANPPEVLAGVTYPDAPSGEDGEPTGLAAASDGPDQPRSAALPASPA